MVIFIATSKRFYPEAKQLISRIGKPGITIYHPYFYENQNQFEGDPQTKAELTLRHFPEIDRSDLLYALLPTGYIGYSVTIEITYAYAKGKKILVSELPNEFAVRAMVSEVRSVEDFEALVKTL